MQDKRKIKVKEKPEEKRNISQQNFLYFVSGIRAKSGMLFI
jgi:hypothetical protein